MDEPEMDNGGSTTGAGPEIWLQSPPNVQQAGELAARAEKAGWHGLQFADGRSGDAFVCLTAAALASSRLRLATGVVNPVVRHPAVLASAISGVARLAGNRVVLGLGRGDSSVRILGLPPATPQALDRILQDLQLFLAGKYIGADGGPHVPWLVADPGVKVPIDVAATGPRVIALAARHAERVTLAVGAETAKVHWGIGQVRETSATCGIGAVAAIGVHHDRGAACELARGPLSVTTHFAAGAARGVPMSESDACVVRSVDRHYDYSEHSRSSSPQGRLLPDDYVRRTAVVGSPGECADRLRELIELGASRIVLMPGTGGPGAASLLDEQDRIADQVLSRL